MNRSKKLTDIRPLLTNLALTKEMSPEERFQNETLRPILKFQNDLFLATFKNYISKGKNKFYELSLLHKFAYISNALQRDVNYRNSLIGMIIGQFTIEEYTEYAQNSSALNKRITSMLIKRLEDQIQIFDPTVLPN